jgi:hypothetical protein
MTRSPVCRTQTSARVWYLERSCMLLVACTTVEWCLNPFSFRAKAELRRVILPITDQLLVDFLCAAFRGPAFYAGPDMKTSHKGLGITNEEWDITLGHIGATLDALGVAAQEKSEVLAAASLKGDIVEV